jgi:hypothetical protein
MPVPSLRRRPPGSHRLQASADATRDDTVPGLATESLTVEDMDGPVLSGGVIVLVAALLWMLYLLPSWRGRYQYNAAERNAVRLNQALRVLAETSETPEEVRVELTTRTALAQQRLAKRVRVEKENAELARLREELAATHNDPALRRARARRRTRQVASSLVVIGLGLAALGAWQAPVAGVTGWLVGGGALIAVGIMLLVRMAQVASRARRRSVWTVQPSGDRVSPPLHDQGSPTWTPRPLPQPMTNVAGSRTQVAQAQLDAQAEVRKAERRAELRRRAEAIAPPEPVRLPTPSEPSYAQMGFVDDAEIEAHVRRMLANRAAG